MESILHESPLGKIHDLNMMKCSKVSQHVAVMTEAALKERKVVETSNTDDHESAWGAWPAYQQDLSEPQNEGGKGIWCMLGS